jgi:hypothetical protein
MHYSNWSGSQPNINPLLEQDVPPVTEHFVNQAQPQPAMANSGGGVAQVRPPPVHHAYAAAGSNASASQMQIPLTPQPPEEEYRDPNATKLSVSHFRPSKEYISGASNTSTDSDEPLHKKWWFWLIVVGAIVALIASVAYFKHMSDHVGAGDKVTFGSGMGTGLGTGVGTNHLLNDLEFL